MALDFQSVAQVVAARGMNTLLEGLLLAGVSWGALRWFGARSSMTRFAVWFSTLLVIATLPLLTASRTYGVGANFRAPELSLSSNWAAGIFLVWAVIASVLLLRLGVSLLHIYKLRHACKEIEAAKFPGLTKSAGEFSSRRVKLLVSDDVRVPTALGFFRPAVVIPSWALRDLSADELKVIVLHELAHLRRWDDWTNLMQQIVKALFFFHPAVWWIDGRLALEREIACDDLVLEQTSSARAYAASLVSVAEKVVAEKMKMGRALALAQSALGRVREVSARITRILDGRPRSSRGWRPAVAMIGTLAVVTIGGMPYAPELVSFQRKSEPTFSAETRGIGSAAVIPASLKWSGYVSQMNPNAKAAGLEDRPNTSRRAGTATTGEDARHPKISIEKSQPLVIRAKATEPPKDPTPRVVMANAAERNKRAESLLVFRSTQVDETGMPVWTLSVWRMTTPNGQTVQEMIVTNSI